MGGGVQGAAVYQIQPEEDEGEGNLHWVHPLEGGVGEDLQEWEAHGVAELYVSGQAQEETDGTLKAGNLRRVESRDGIQMCRQGQGCHGVDRVPRTGSSGSQPEETRAGSCNQNLRQAVWRGTRQRVNPGHQYPGLSHLPTRLLPGAG